MNDKPFGWEVDVEFCDRLVYAPDGGPPNWTQTFHYRGSKSQAILRAKLKKHAKRVVAVRPVSEEEWRRAYGDPEERRL